MFLRVVRGANGDAPVTCDPVRQRWSPNGGSDQMSFYASSTTADLTPNLRLELLVKMGTRGSVPTDQTHARTNRARPS